MAEPKPELPKETTDQLWAIKRHALGLVKAIEKLVGRDPDAVSSDTKER